jgi:hypothetical protein
MKNTKDYLDEAINKTLQTGNISTEDRLLKLVEAERTVSSLGNVVNFIISDAFNLTSEETIWVSMMLTSALEPLKKVIPSATMGAVTQEMLNGIYSLRMFERDGQPNLGKEIVYNDSIKFASATDWTEGIYQIVYASYPNLRPAISSRIIGSIYGVFTELGVKENPKESRVSSYLPNNIRYLLNQQ